MSNSSNIDTASEDLGHDSGHSLQAPPPPALAKWLGVAVGRGFDCQVQKGRENKMLPRLRGSTMLGTDLRAVLGQDDGLRLQGHHAPGPECERAGRSKGGDEKRIKLEEKEYTQPEVPLAGLPQQFIDRYPIRVLQSNIVSNLLEAIVRRDQELNGIQNPQSFIETTRSRHYSAPFAAERQSLLTSPEEDLLSPTSASRPSSAQGLLLRQSQLSSKPSQLPSSPGTTIESDTDQDVNVKLSRNADGAWEGYQIQRPSKAKVFQPPCWPRMRLSKRHIPLAKLEPAGPRPKFAVGQEVFLLTTDGRNTEDVYGKDDLFDQKNRDGNPLVYVVEERSAVRMCIPRADGKSRRQIQNDGSVVNRYTLTASSRRGTRLRISEGRLMAVEYQLGEMVRFKIGRLRGDQFNMRAGEVVGAYVKHSKRKYFLIETNMPEQDKVWKDVNECDILPCEVEHQKG